MWVEGKGNKNEETEPVESGKEGQMLQKKKQFRKGMWTDGE